jgi:hypothetical protein
LFVTIAHGIVSTNLTPASRRQDHTASPSASALFVKSATRVHHIPPHVRDDRETPLRRDGTAVDKPVIWVCGKEKYFWRRGWTGM